MLSQNKKAYHDYIILEKIEAGIVLAGTEVKSVREGKMNLKESYARFINHELWLLGCHISPYTHGNRFNLEPTRNRKLLLHKKQILKLSSKVQEKGLTIVPLSAYLSKGKIKIQVGVAKAKKTVDKRESLKDKTIQRDIQRGLAYKN